VIVALGRPGLSAPRPGAEAQPRPGGLAVRIAIACREAGARVELVGSLGEDPEGDLVVTGLGQAGVGHAALLRDPGARTPRLDGQGRVVGEGPLPRLDAADIDLALRYLPDCRVLVVTEPLGGDAASVTAEAASFHGAAVVAIVPAGTAPDPAIAEVATVLEVPMGRADGAGEADGEDGADGDGESAPGEGDGTNAAFAALVARYAAGLDAGRAARDAFEEAVRGTGWEARA
jgi:ribokinase